MATTEQTQTGMATCPLCDDYEGQPSSVEAHISRNTDPQHKGEVGRAHRDQLEKEAAEAAEGATAGTLPPVDATGDGSESSVEDGGESPVESTGDSSVESSDGSAVEEGAEVSVESIDDSPVDVEVETTERSVEGAPETGGSGGFGIPLPVSANVLVGGAVVFFLVALWWTWRSSSSSSSASSGGDREGQGSESVTLIG